METALTPASPSASRPLGVKVNAKGTGVEDGFWTGVSESRPLLLTWKTSTVLPLAFVVTMSCRPSGVNRTASAQPTLAHPFNIT